MAYWLWHTSYGILVMPVGDGAVGTGPEGPFVVVAFKDGSAGRATMSPDGKALEWEDGSTWARGIQGVGGSWYDEDNQCHSSAPAITT